MRDKAETTSTPYNLASLVRGMYARVADHLEVDPSYVSRVARGERESQMIEVALEREMKRIMSLVASNRNGDGRNGHSRNGNNHHNGSGKKKQKSR